MDIFSERRCHAAARGGLDDDFFHRVCIHRAWRHEEGVEIGKSAKMLLSVLESVLNI